MCSPNGRRSSQQTFCAHLVKCHSKPYGDRPTDRRRAFAVVAVPRAAGRPHFCGQLERKTYAHYVTLLRDFRFGSVVPGAAIVDNYYGAHHYHAFPVPRSVQRIDGRTHGTSFWQSDLIGKYYCAQIPQSVIFGCLYDALGLLQ